MKFWQNLWKLLSNPRSEVISTSEDLDAFLRSGGGDTWAGITVSVEEAMGYAPFSTAVRVLDENISQLPLHIFRRGEEDERERTKARDFHIQKRLKRPNDWMSGIEWRGWNIRHASTTGDAVSLINRISRTREIAELLPIHPSRVEIEQLSNWEVVYHITDKDGTRRTFPKERIFHFRGPTENGINGINVIQKHRQSIALAIAQDRMAAKLFSRGALLSGAFTVPGKFTEEQRKHNEEAIRGAYSGENALSFALLEGGAKFEPTMMDFERAQLLESRKLQRTVVAAILRVPMHMVGDLDKATFSNIQNLARQAVDYTFMPWLVRFEQAIENQLMTEEEREVFFAKHNVDSLLRGTPLERAQVHNLGITGGWKNPNEAREEEDRSPREGGDDFKPAENIFGNPDRGGQNVIPESQQKRILRLSKAVQ